MAIKKGKINISIKSSSFKKILAIPILIIYNFLVFIKNEENLKFMFKVVLINCGSAMLLAILFKKPQIVLGITIGSIIFLVGLFLVSNNEKYTNSLKDTWKFLKRIRLVDLAEKFKETFKVLFKVFDKHKTEEEDEVDNSE